MQREMQRNISPQAANVVRRNFATQLAMLDDFSVQAVKAKSATQQYTEALSKNEITLKQALSSRQTFNTVLREQYQLQRMTAIEWSRNASGMMKADIIVPRGTSQEVRTMTSSLGANIKAMVTAKKGTSEFAVAMDVMRMRVGMANQVLGSVAQNLIKWGKNTQWAGRQLMVGLTVPLAAFAALAGSVAYKTDQELTRIAKVYDTTATTLAGKTKELDQLRIDSMKMATEVAKEYGASLQDTLSAEADLAATGLKGQALLRSSAEVQRASILGEMNYQDTVKATIALQSVYHYSTNQLTDAFNYMNATENATNLTMQDFVEAIPRASGPLKQLGVNLQQTGVLMAAMKSAGIDASIGANALRSGIYRLLNPTPAAIKMMKSFGISLDEVVKKSKGNFYDAMISLSQQMKDLGNVQQQQAIGKIFGIQRAGQITAIVQQLRNVHDQTTQVGRAFQVASQSTAQWGQVAAGEMTQVRQSISGKFRIAIQSFKAELASMGQPFLKVATMIVGGVTKILGAFNHLSSGKKTFLAIVLGIGAMAGAVIMLTGLMANLAGQALNGIKWMASWGGRFEAMTVEQRAAKMLSEQSTAAWNNQAHAAMTLSNQLAMLTRRMDSMVMAQRRLNAGITGDPIIARNSSGRMYDQMTGKYVAASSAGQFLSEEAEAKRITEESTVTARNWGVIGKRVAGLGLGVSLLGTMVSSSGSLVSKISNVVFLASLVGPMLYKGLKMVFAAGGTKTILSGLSGSLGKIGTAFSGGKATGGILAGLRAALPVAGELVGTLAKGFGITGIVATGALMFLKAWQHQKALVAAQEQINNSAQDWANILGFVYEDYRKINSEQAAKGPNAVDQAAISLNKANPALVKYLQLLHQQGKEQEIVNSAIYEGIKAFEHGATPGTANMAVRVALRASGYNTQDINALMVNIMKRINFSDDASVVKNAQEQFGLLWRKALSGNNSQVDETLTTGFAKEWSNIFNNLPTPQGRLKMFDNLRDQIAQSEDEFFTNLPKDIQTAMHQHGINSFQDLLMTQIQAEQGNGSANQTMTDLRTAGLNWNGLKTLQNNETALAKAIATANGMSADQVNSVHTLSDVITALNMPLNTVSKAQLQYASALDSARVSHEKLSPEQKLALLNYYRLSAGLDKATSLEQGFGAALDSTTGKLKKHAAAASAAALSDDDYANALKTAMGGAQDAALSRADELWSRMAEDQQNAIQNAANKEKAALGKSADLRKSYLNMEIKDSNRYYNTKVNALNKEMNQEQKAEQQRQSNFDAEKARLQQMADMANQNTDFNAAVDLGNLDEAAKIANDMQASQDSSALDQAQQASQAASDARVKQYQNEIKHLQSLQKAHVDALKAELNRYSKSLTAQKNAIDRKEQADQKANQRFMQDQKDMLDLQLATIKASTPRNQAEYNKQISQIEAAYQKYGVNLEGYGSEWSGYIGAALNANIAAAAAGLKDKIDWTGIGKGVANKFTQGALGLNIKQFAQWVMTGKLPKSGLNPGGMNAQGGVGNKQYGPAIPSHHAGGPVGQRDNRAGRSKSAGLSNDEMMIRAQKGEYVINAAAHKALGTDYLDSINSAPMGLVGIAGGSIAGIMASAVENQILSVAGSMAGGVRAGGVAGYGGAAIPAPESVQHWRPYVIRALQMLGLPYDAQMINGELSLISHEGSSPTSVNRWDSNWKAGHPSVGLTQTIDSTYAAYAGPFKNKMPKLYGVSVDALGQIYAGLNYAWQNYGLNMIRAGGRHDAAGNYIGYDKGGVLNPGSNSVFNGTKKPEFVFTSPQWSTLSKLAESAVVTANRQGKQIDHPTDITYDIKMDFNGAHFATDLDIENAVEKTIIKIERKHGPIRRIRD